VEPARVTPEGRHLTDDQLVDVIEGRIAPAQDLIAQDHLSRCAECSRQAAAFRRLLDLIRTDTSADPPDYVVNRAVRLLRTYRTPNTQPRARRLLTAVLRRDSAQSGFAMAVRGSRSSRQLLFEIDQDREVEVRIEQADGGWRVAGQILGNCGPGQVVLEGVAGRSTAEMNAQCEFVLPPHPGAVYRLVLEFDDVEVDVPILELRG
jgi:hypothetical protein